MTPSEYSGTIKEEDSLELLWGERFRGWYRFMQFKRTEQVLLKDDLTFQLKVCEHQYRFVMPPRIEFFKGIGDEGKIEYGIIKYSEPERAFGMFRFPQGEDGFFSAPVTVEKTAEQVATLTQDQLMGLVHKRKVLTFEAFRIPLFCFDYFHVAENDFVEIKKLAGEDISRSVRTTYESTLEDNISSVKDKILSNPDYLLILGKVLDMQYKNEKEISVMTNGLLHFGI